MTKAAIAVLDPTLDVTQYPQFTNNNIVVVGNQTSTWQVTLASVYFEGDLASTAEPRTNAQSSPRVGTK